MPIHPPFPYGKILLGVLVALHGLLLSETVHARGNGGNGFSKAGHGGQGDGQSGGGGWWENWDTRGSGVMGQGANGGHGHVADGGNGGAAGYQLTGNAAALSSSSGQNGNAGENTRQYYGAGGGGAGGAGAFINTDGLSIKLAPAAQLHGGNGGNGGEAVLAAGGGGGGGAGLQGSSSRTSITIGPASQIIGGNGGKGGNSLNNHETSGGGGGGGGGSGVNIQGNANTIDVQGQVLGGNAGHGGTAPDANRNGAAGQGGAGIRLQGDNNRLIVSGLISGGLNATDGAYAEAVRLIGNENRVELQAGYSIRGNVTATGSGNTLALGGTSLTASFDASKIGSQFLNFSSFEKNGSGTWSLTGTSSGNRNWNVLSGTLVGTTSSIGNGNINNAASLVFNQAQTGTYSGAISGAGTLNKTGSGTLILTGSASHTGGTTVSTGTLQIGNGGTTGSLSGNILNDATLSFNRSNTSVHAGNISGTGSVRQAGSGTLILTGDASHTGGTIVSSGTLQIGNGGTSGSLSGNILNNAALSVNRSDTVFYAGDISGSGSVRQAGSGTLILIGNATYTGGTTLSNGTLQIGNGATSGSLSGNILNNATLSFNRSNTSVHAGDISGTGSVRQAGSGTLILTGNASHTGGTSVSAGTLQIGNGGTTGSLSGTVLNDATLSFNRADDQSYLGDISGSGRLIQAGSGSLMLGSANSYQGGTQILGGRLSGSAGSFGSGAIVNDGILAIDQQADALLHNSLSGTGTLYKQGAGKLVLEGVGSIMGDTQIETGSLIIGGSAGSSASLASNLTSHAGTRIGGHGQLLGDVRLLADSILAPGNSIGTFNVDGNVTFDSGSLFEVEVDATGASDRLVSTQTVDIEGAALRVLASPGDWSPATTYSIINAAQINGTFASVSSNLAFLTSVVDYSVPTEVRLSLLRNDVRFDSVAQTYNQRASASAVESSGVSQQVYRAVSVLDPDRARQAFDDLSGELHASVQSALIDDSRYLRDGITSRLLSAQGLRPSSGQLNDDKVTFWLQGHHASAHDQADGNASSLDRTGQGALFGADLPVSDHWRLGAAFGQASSRLKDGRSSTADTTTRSLALYASGEYGAIRLRAGAAHSWHGLSTERQVEVGNISETPRTRYDATTHQAFAELGYRLQLGDYAVEPFLGLAHAEIRRGGFAERGGESALRSGGEKHAANYSNVGLNAVTTVGKLGNAPISLHGRLSWQQALGSAPAESRHALANSDIFRVRGTDPQRERVAATLGVAAQLNSNTRLDLDYSGRFGREHRDNVLRIGITVGF